MAVGYVALLWKQIIIEPPPRQSTRIVSARLENERIRRAFLHSYQLSFIWALESKENLVNHTHVSLQMADTMVKSPVAEAPQVETWWLPWM